MPKQFYTEKDIEDLFQSGVKSIRLTDEVVLTELAYEKASRLGVKLITDRPDIPPAAPVRPYLSEKPPAPAKPGMSTVSQIVAQPQPPLRPDTGGVEQRIRSAVIAKLGNQVDAKLLDNIIHRVVKSTGLK
jgi:hypothetical protein